MPCGSPLGLIALATAYAVGSKAITDLKRKMRDRRRETEARKVASMSVTELRHASAQALEDEEGRLSWLIYESDWRDRASVARLRAVRAAMQQRGGAL